MNCHGMEERISLYAGGDLRPEEAAGVERHVAECAGCQLLLSGLWESLRLLREAHCEPVDEAHFAAVRARVMSRIERGRSPWWRQVWVYAAAVAVVALLVVAVRPVRKSAPVPLPRVATSVGGAAAPVRGRPPGRPALPPRNSAGKVRPARRRSAPPAQKAEEPAQPLVVKLLTNDPDVVIYWITDTKGE